jgi:hypothetical protein
MFATESCRRILEEQKLLVNQKGKLNREGKYLLWLKIGEQEKIY